MVDPERFRKRIEEIKATAIAESLETAQISRLLSISGAAIRRRRASRQIYAFPLNGRWLYPVWQIDGEHLIPNLDDIVPAIPLWVHPAMVRLFMLAPRPLVDGESKESPRDFLIRGGGPAPVVEMFEAVRDL